MKYLLLFLAIAMVGCVSHETPTPPPIDYAPASGVSPQEALQIAESYRAHSWKPGTRNIHHGLDPKGILVNTPDTSMGSEVAERPGWWVPGKINVGIPYQWGGFDTPASFQRKLQAGYYAGDVYTTAKRSGLYSEVSSYACGIDCSGFVSRCWRLPRPFSTRELPSLCKQLTSYEELKAGDIVNKRNVHVLLFDKFLDPEKKWFLAYETGSPPSWKVLRHRISVDYVKNLGYLPYRYNHIRLKNE